MTTPTMPAPFTTATKHDIAAMHAHLADLHEFLARTSRLDVIHEAHADLADRLRQEAKEWSDMPADIFDSKMGRAAA